MSVDLRLPDDLVESIAERAAQIVAERQAPVSEPLMTAVELAARLRVTTDWVRRHQAALGAFRLSDGGGRNPIRFRLTDVETFLAKRRLTPPTGTREGGWRDDPDWASG